MSRAERDCGPRRGSHFLAAEPSGAFAGGMRRNTPSGAVFRKAGNGAVRSVSELEQVRGIEPPCSAWEADILPLNYTCIDFTKSAFILYHIRRCFARVKKKEKGLFALDLYQWDNVQG